MADHQQLLDGIHGVLDQANRGFREEMRTLAREFAEVCRATEARLCRCEDYLRRGLLGEAVHLAEIQPPLMDLLGLLEFPRRDEWENLVQSHSLPVGVRILFERGLSLQKIYEQHKPLESLLRQYRRLHLSQAPILERLVVARQLAALDSLNSFWQEDIEQLERSAHEELEAQIAEVRQRDKPEELAKLLAQIQSIAWLTPPNAELLRTLRSLVENHAAHKAKQRLPNIIRGLKYAMDRLDVQTATKLRNEMALELQSAQVVPEDRLYQQLNQVTAWIERQHRRLQELPLVQQAQQQFRAALSRPKATLKEVQEAYRSLIVYEQTIPPELLSLYQEFKKQHKEEKQEQKETFERMGNYGILAVAIPTMIFVLGIFVWMIVAMLLRP
jgi:hypothetical protein